MIQDVTHRQECENLMRGHSDLQQQKYGLNRLAITIEKIASLTHSQEYELATAKSTRTPYKMLMTLGNDLDWLEIKENLKRLLSYS